MSMEDAPLIRGTAEGVAYVEPPPTNLWKTESSFRRKRRPAEFTRQGVRALGWARKVKPEPLPPDCDHRWMRWHCHPRNCGHLLCRCGLYWDVGAEC